MIKFFRKLWRDRRGNALVIAGAALPLIIGSAGLASDTIQWVLWKRQLQRAANSAAIAGVYAKMQNQTVSSAITTDLAKNQNTGIVTAERVSADHLSDDHQHDQRSQCRSRCSEVARVFGRVRILGADHSGFCHCGDRSDGRLLRGQPRKYERDRDHRDGQLDVEFGCGMITNSTSLNAAIATGSSSVTASPIAAVGDIQDSTHWNGAELLPFTVAEKDPFAAVDPPSFTGCQGSSNRINVNNPHDVLDRSTDTGVQCVSDINVSGTLKLGSATYVIDSGNFSAGAQANVSCTGCTIIFTNSTSGSTATIGGITNINGGAQLNMSAPISGTYNGILFVPGPPGGGGDDQLGQREFQLAAVRSLLFPKIRSSTSTAPQISPSIVGNSCPGHLLRQRQHQQHLLHRLWFQSNHRQSCEAGRVTRLPRNTCSRLPRRVGHRAGACGSFHGDPDHRHRRYQPRLFRQG